MTKRKPPYDQMRGRPAGRCCANGAASDSPGALISPFLVDIAITVPRSLVVFLVKVLSCPEILCDSMIFFYAVSDFFLVYAANAPNCY